jgi:ribosomal protein S12 methylthiotransferase
MKVAIIMLGCPKNDVDAETMLYQLRNAGHETVADPAEADVIIVNTCGFIKDAKQESVDALLEMAEFRKTGKCRLLVATGCLPQRYKGQLFDAMPEVDMMIGVNEYDKIVQLIEDGTTSGRLLQCTDQIGSPSITGRVLTSPGSYAYLKIAEGCSNRCAYCAIPDIRGPYRSRSEDEIIQEAKWLTEQGVLELILVAQDITRYGMEKGVGSSLAELLKKLIKIEGLGRLRLLYCYPELITDELLELIISEEKICSYIDVPLQHIDDGKL